ncbi:MAG TPA: phytanoyl-CoA dioxygenase family protein [Chthonomonadaceae bacterium]|nr:phytanoyl-CoA dioxygenase family protein [Chthonomonadaceae bacterium]
MTIGMTGRNEAAGARAQYEADGFYLAQWPLFPAELVERAAAGLEAVRAGEYDTGRAPQPSPWKPGDDPNTLCKIEQPQFASRALRDLLRCPALGEMAAALTGARRVQAWWVQGLVKPSLPRGVSGGTNVGWHQDRHYWNIWDEGSELFTAWIALSDVREESGAMRFVPGSHRWGLMPHNDFFAQELAAQREAMRAPNGAEWRETAAVLPPGGVSFHDDFTLHASGPNVSDAPRRSLAVHLRTERSRPVGDARTGLTQFIDDLDLCPVIYGV